MPPSHPRPETVSTLVDALSRTGEHCADDGEVLLDHLVTVGDHGTQAALESTVDAAVDVLRELSATHRELALALATDTSPTRRTAASHERTTVRETQ